MRVAGIYVHMDPHTWQRNLRVPHFVLSTGRRGGPSASHTDEEAEPQISLTAMDNTVQILAGTRVPCAKSYALFTSQPTALQSWCLLGFGRE